MNNLISRSDLRKILEKYVNKEISLKKLYQWHENMIKNNFGPLDWEGDESFVNEVMNVIDMSDIEGLSVDKTKKIIKLLKLNENTKILVEELYK